jgi:3-oxoacyl-[acyl-carrier protein] reductase
MIIVFGANGTLGREICSQLIDANVDLILTANTGYKRLVDLYSKEEKILHIKKCDVELEDDISALFDLIKMEDLKIDAVINNFAFTYSAEEIQLKGNEKNINKIFNTNYIGVARIMDHLLSNAKYNKDKKIRVVNVLSNAIKTLNASNQHYIASKAAAKILAEFYAKNFSHLLTINNVCPGLMRSNLTNSRFKNVVEQIEKITPLKRLAAPHEVAELIIYLSIHSPSSLCGQTLYIDGGRTL